MKLNLIISLILIISTSFSKKDFIDHWRIFLDDELVKECYENYDYCNVELNPKKEKFYKQTLSFQFFRDTPCEECPINYQIKNEYDSLLMEIKTYGIFTKVNMPLSALILKNKTKLTKVYFIETYDLTKKSGTISNFSTLQ